MKINKGILSCLAAALLFSLFTFTQSASAAVPSPWLQQDIGSVGVAGTGNYASGTFTIQATGTDIAGTADQFRYVYQPLSGDGTIVARVASISNTSAWAKGGVMIREALTTGAKHVSTVIEYASTSGAQMVSRSAASGSTATVTQTGVAAPYWVKLQRAGNVFTSSISSNGTTWTQVGTVTVSMSSSAYVGLAVTAQNNTTLNTTTIDNVTVSGSTSSGPAFVKGINLNGAATTIEGNSWISYASALSSGLSVSNATSWSGTYSFSLNPTPDATTQTMMQSALYRSAPPNGQGFSLNQTIANGSYQVYLWTIENYQSNFRNEDVKLEGTTVATGIGDLALGSWAKYGPYSVTVSDGTLNIDILRSTKGDPQMTGVAIYSTGGGTSSDTQAPTAPSGLASPSKTDTTVNLTWTASTDNVGVTGYDIYRGGTTLAGTTTGATSATITGLTASTAYTFTVKARDAANNQSAASNSLAVTTNASTGNRSGLPWKSGVYRTTNDQANWTAIQNFETWRGRLADITTNFPYRYSWDIMTVNGAFFNGWQNAPWTPTYAVPMFPENIGATFSACAAGSYNSNWTTFANNLVSHGQGGAIIRLGWEFNGNWFAHSVTNANMTDWKACFRQVATTIKAAAPNVKIDWNVTRGDGLKAAGNADPALVYPGDDVVDYIGVDSYDQWPPAFNDATWISSHIGGTYGLQHWIDFAVAHGKKFSVPEWGLYHGAAPNFGNDNPFYIEKMWSFFNSLGSTLAYEAYYDEDVLTLGNLSYGNNNPNSAPVYNSHW
ncbi:hypothetical protein GZH47_25045 [Paenibacillus rhizovicinus]|uniref:Fibronectin type-III domain-containing protein n=1 Tax=Paenibacillus rhizovicinus TaxID=2704463 RepID=A0A6C0P7Y3_9BACL|nr:fibronectin type III domain-containing protein [Paenibacillus rhizovicinus]QHW33743.1 hypothetical protein GZH47_25045 [Paenibacillus rhizovicinus]